MEHTNETRVLGAALSEPGIWLAQAPRISADLFVEYHLLAKAILEMRELGKETDPQSVHSWLGERGIKSSLATLVELSDHAALSTPSMAQAVDALHERAKREAIRRLAGWLDREVTQSKSRADEIVARGIGQLSEIAAKSAVGPKAFGKVLQCVMNQLGRPPTNTVKTGIGTVDAITGGFQPGQFVIVGARPSMGKTSLAMGFIRQAAAAGKSVLLLSLEMSAEQVCHRVLADLSKVNLARISTHRLSGNDMTALVNAAQASHKYAIWIGETGDNIDPVARQIKHRSGLDMVVVDYLQLMSIKGESREQQIATLSRNLKGLARSLGVPVVALSQLNRQIEQRANKRPQLSDLRESGSLEQDADIVLLLWRPGYYDPQADQSEAELIVAKHRNGPTGLVELEWQATRAQFVDKQPTTSRGATI